MNMKVLSLLALIAILSTNNTKGQLSDITFHEFPNCAPIGTSSEIVVNNYEEFSVKFNCVSLNFDFSKYTILAIQGRMKGHDQAQIDFQIKKDDNLKSFLISATIYGGKVCNCRVMKPGYDKVVYIDKVPAGYTIKFNILEKYDN
jgi:hypothetical protein